MARHYCSRLPCPQGASPCRCCKRTRYERYPLLTLQVRTASCGATACVNSFGDEQLAVDLLADKLLFEALRFSVSAACPSVGWSFTHQMVIKAEHFRMPTSVLLLMLLIALSR